jgi:SAM-dependent methyltransferase
LYVWPHNPTRVDEPGNHADPRRQKRNSMTSAYDSNTLLDTYRELHFGIPGQQASDPDEVKAAATFLLDAVDVAKPFYDGIAAPLGELRPATVLDAGCGLGRLGHWFAAALPDVTYVGLDYSTGMIREAASQAAAVSAAAAAPPLLFIAGDATRPPFPSASFDLVIAANLVDRVDRPNDVICALWTLVKPGGHLFLTDPFHWEDTPLEERFFSFEHVTPMLVDGQRVPFSPHRSVFCVRRRDGDRVIVYLNENALYQKTV